MNAFTRRNLYITLVVLLLLPVALVRLFPNEASVVRIVIALCIFPLVAGALLFETIGPFIQAAARPQNITTKYILLRVLLAVVAIGIVATLVVPSWRGAYELYVTGAPPDTVRGVTDTQGSGLTVPLFDTSIYLKGKTDDYVWLYGNFLPASTTYTLFLLPGSNMVLDVVPDGIK